MSISSTTASAAASPSAHEGRKDEHRQAWGTGTPMSREQQRTVYAVGHLAAGFLNMLLVAPLGAWVDLADAAPDSGGGGAGAGGAHPATGAAKALGVTETLVRGVTMVTEHLDAPVPLRNSTAASIRDSGELIGVLLTGGATCYTWSTSSQAIEKVEAVLDVATAVVALVPTIWSLVELAEEGTSTERTMSIVDEVGTLCESAGAFIHLCAVVDEEDVSKAVFVSIELALVFAAGLLHLGQAMIALGADRKADAP